MEFLLSDLPDAEQNFVNALLKDKPSATNSLMGPEKGHDVRQTTKLLSDLLQFLLENSPPVSDIPTELPIDFKSPLVYQK